METLNVGDKLVSLTGTSYGCRYEFTKVVRLTNTTAILENGNKVKINSEPRGFDGSRFESFRIIGNSSRCDYQRQTNKIIKAHNADVKKRKISNWFLNFKPTDEQKEQIYDLLNPTLQGE